MNTERQTSKYLYSKASKRYMVLFLVYTALGFIISVVFPLASISPLAMLLTGVFIGMSVLMVIPLRSIPDDPRPLEERKDFYSSYHDMIKHVIADAQMRISFPPRTRGGYVYLIRDVDVTGYYKIGKTQDPRSRIGHFDTMLPFNTAVVKIIPCSDCSKVESFLHWHFAGKRVRGEWFNLTAEDVAWIKTIGANTP